jgi:hypothetical protein
MTRIRRIRRLAAVLAGLAGALLAFAAAAPAALAAPGPPVPPGGPKHPLPPGHAAFGAMPGWQIALIAAGATLLAPTVAVLWDRARPARRNPATGAAPALHLPSSPR